MKPTDDGGQLLSEWKCSFHGDTARGAAETAVILDKRLAEAERKIHVLGVAPGESSGADAEDRHMAKKTTARGKPDYVTREQMLDELVLSNRAGGQEMAAVRETLNLLGERVNVLDSRVTGEIKVLRERLKAGEKRAEPIGGLEDRLKLVAVELSKLHSTDSKLEERLSKLNDVLVQALKRIEELEGKADG